MTLRAVFLFLYIEKFLRGLGCKEILKWTFTHFVVLLAQGTVSARNASQINLWEFLRSSTCTVPSGVTQRHSLPIFRISYLSTLAFRFI